MSRAFRAEKHPKGWIIPQAVQMILAVIALLLVWFTPGRRNMADELSNWWLIGFRILPVARATESETRSPTAIEAITAKGP